MSDQQTYIDIYGFRIEVEGRIVPFFQLEYGWFEAETFDAPPDVRIKPCEGSTDPHLTPKGQTTGITFEGWDGDVLTMRYQPRVSARFISRWMEQLLQWPDRTLAHAAGVVKDGRAYVLFAAGGVGKTSSVIRLVRRGYDYLADDWIVIGNGRAYPFPKTIHVFDYNLKNDPELCRRLYGRLPMCHVMRLRHWIRKRAQAIPGNGRVSRAFRLGVKAALKRCRLVPLSTMEPGAAVAKPAQLEAVAWMTRSSCSSPRVSDLPISDLVNRIVNIRIHERQRFLGGIAKCRAQSGARLSSLDELEHEREVLVESLRHVNAHLIEIPDTTVPDELVEVLEDSVLAEHRLE